MGTLTLWTSWMKMRLSLGSFRSTLSYNVKGDRTITDYDAAIAFRLYGIM